MSIAQTMFRNGNSAPLRAKDITPWGRVNFNMFFDRVQVTSALDKKELRVLSRTGAFARGYMRRLFRSGGKKGKQSEPGQPPRYHSRGFASLKDGVFFQANLDAGAVIIGPNRLKTNTDPVGKASSAQLLEEGGTATINSFRYNKPRRQGPKRGKGGRFQKRTGQFVAGRWTRRPAKYQARPFAEPTQKPAQDKCLELIRTIPV